MTRRRGAGKAPGGGPDATCDRPRPAHAWEALRGWETLFGLTLAVAVLFVAGDGKATPAAKAATLALLAVGAAGYVLLGRRALTQDEHDSPRALLYWALIAVAFIPAVILVRTSAFVLFALCSQAFMMLRLRTAVVVVLIFNLLPAARFLFRPPDDTGDLLSFAGSTAIILTFTLVFGPWISRIIDQSAERAKLIRDLEESRGEVARLSAERGALAERERLAGEIHDTLAQGLSSIIMLLQAAEARADPATHLDLAVRTARENLAEARALIAALSPPPLDGSTLEEALRRVTARLGEETGATASFAAEGASRPLPPNVEVVLLRAAQEGLANVRKHATADSVAVTLEYGGDRVSLRVRDDGAGFRAGSAQGYGLRAMRGRVEQEGGTFAVESSPGHGTTLRVALPTSPGAGRDIEPTGQEREP
ncbi:sensor histidine kinase [Microbispora sp. RL4-1S]|uniref:Oxygen sensor histidine kinase NreB n=1 Tax=Microbispora oryzae TaxID=2806554 RepID=A0A940WGQ0_9ACTN|nr:sensor histidine kinase [Microbispora oryzae]MBP2705211.1 sensor histidine kinase [Microbispora oryzae]